MKVKAASGEQRGRDPDSSPRGVRWLRRWRGAGRPGNSAAEGGEGGRGDGPWMS